MTLIEFAKAYAILRKAQKAYFAARYDGRSASLEWETARMFERDLDAKAEQILSDCSTFDLFVRWEATP